MVAKDGKGIGLTSTGTTGFVPASPFEGIGRGRLLLALTAAKADAASVLLLALLAAVALLMRAGRGRDRVLFIAFLRFWFFLR